MSMMKKPTRPSLQRFRYVVSDTFKYTTTCQNYTQDMTETPAIYKCGKVIHVYPRGNSLSAWSPPPPYMVGKTEPKVPCMPNILRFPPRKTGLASNV